MVLQENMAEISNESPNDNDLDETLSQISIDQSNKDFIYA